MTKIYVSLPDKLEADARSAAKASYKTLSAYIRDALIAYLPKPVTAKPLSVREEKAERLAIAKGKWVAIFRRQIQTGAGKEDIRADAKHCPQFEAWYDEALAIELGPHNQDNIGD
jgi:hypothetical protein